MTTRPLTVLLAPDKFKGTLTAAEVVAALVEGITQSLPHVRLLACPIADGGDGTVDAAIAAGAEPRPHTITGPTGRPRNTRWALQGDTAVLELADSVGLQALPTKELAPLTSSTRGLGELILAAKEAGARTILVGLGGSASTDAGTGLLQALGARLLTRHGTDIPPGLEGLAQLAHADLEPARRAVEGVRLIAASDVTNPLLGPDGAAAVYGPQKGLHHAQIQQADVTLSHAARVLDPEGTCHGRTAAGAAGGTGFGLFLLGAEHASGADMVLELTEFDRSLADADVVITGEGKIDAQTLQGKGPAEVARRAQAAGLPVFGVAGAITLEESDLRTAGICAQWDLVSRAGTVERALTEGPRLLREIGADIGRALAGSTSTERGGSLLQGRDR